MKCKAMINVIKAQKNSVWFGQIGNNTELFLATFFLLPLFLNSNNIPQRLVEMYHEHAFFLKSGRQNNKK